MTIMIVHHHAIVFTLGWVGGYACAIIIVYGCIECNGLQEYTMMRHKALAGGGNESSISSAMSR